jgi:hypothetical protein
MLFQPASSGCYRFDMNPPLATVRHLHDALSAASQEDSPFRHWLLADVLPVELYRALRDLDLGPPPPAESAGRRETHNAQRLFFGTTAQVRFTAAAGLASAFQHPDTVAAIEARTGTSLRGTSLRIEYCLDTAGFWLEPHTDIGAKKFTMLIYLSDCPGAEAWGTDFLSPQGELVRRPPAHPNSAAIFIPSTDTWHGFARRPIEGIRRTLIVNFVGPEWQARHELCFPDQPV